MNEPPPPDADGIERLLRSFTRPGAEETALSSVELWTAAPGVVLEVLRVHPGIGLPAPLAQAFGDLAAELGIVEGATIEELEAAFAAYYRRQPRLVAALAEVRRELRGVLAGAGDEAPSKVNGLLGAQANPFQPRTDVPPAGAVKAQPWARFFLQNKNLEET